MLDALIRYSLRYRMLVMITSLIVLAYGSYLATQMTIDVFPDLDRPRVVVITEAPGLATEEVETLVTQPIEIAILGANGVQAVRSQSSAGLNVLYVEFDWDTEIRTARQTVSERLATLSGVLPEGIRPLMTPPSSIMGQVVVAGVYRQAGPKGGLLTPIDQTPFVAELTDSTNGHEISVWKPLDRHRVNKWVLIDHQKVSIAHAPADEDLVVLADLEIEGQRHEVRFESEAKRSLELRTIADWIVRPRLLKVTGVAEVFLVIDEHPFVDSVTI
ncbi:MAG: efflux RND transporter permease subunit, partial [Planctomycetota bacterium]